MKSKKKSTMKGTPNYALRIRTLHDKGVYDPDTLILHAVFECVAEFVDDVEQLGLTHHSDEYKVSKAYLTWFRKDWTKREKHTVEGKPLPKRPKGKKHFNLSKPYIDSKGRRQTQIYFSAPMKRWLDAKNASDKRWKLEEQKTLSNIIGMRPSLWA